MTVGRVACGSGVPRILPYRTLPGVASVIKPSVYRVLLRLHLIVFTGNRPTTGVIIGRKELSRQSGDVVKTSFVVEDPQLLIRQTSSSICSSYIVPMSGQTTRLFFVLSRVPLASPVATRTQGRLYSRPPA